MFLGGILTNTLAFLWMQDCLATGRRIILCYLLERDGMIWQAKELHLEELPDNLTPLDAMANALALEGLEDYNPAPQCLSGSLKRTGEVKSIASVGNEQPL